MIRYVFYIIQIVTCPRYERVIIIVLQTTQCKISNIFKMTLQEMLLLKCEQRRIIFQAQHFFNNFLFGPFTFVVVIISSRKDMKHLSKLYSLTTSFLLSYVRKETYIALVKKRPFYTANDTINSLQTRKSLRPIWG